MWQDPELLERFQTNYTIATNARVLAEINLNALATPEKIGVYRRSTTSFGDPQYMKPPMIYQSNFTDYLHWDEPLQDIPVTLINDKNTLLSQYFSLKDCFTFRRPRAGIVYPLFFNSRSTVYLENYTTSKRPRNYITGKAMPFKYWTSLWIDPVDYQTVRGISDTVAPDGLPGFEIDNAAPFIVYTEPVYANKLVIKLQTHNGEPHVVFDSDPVADTWWVPFKWHVEYLNDNNQWINIKTFTEQDDIPTDGNIELMYGPAAPLGYEDTFRLYGSVELMYELEKIPMKYRHVGMAYIFNDSALMVWDGLTWVIQELKFGWIRSGEEVFQYAINKIVDPNPDEFVKMRGVRIWVERMQQSETPFELIELSPRLQLNITQYISATSITKSLGLSDILPISDISNDVGSITLTNYDLAFSRLNKYDGLAGSIIADYMTDNTKIIFYNQINNIQDAVASKFIPIKTMYVEKWPINDPGTGDMTINLRDYMLFLDGIKAPDLFFTNISLSYVISVLLDNAGISNYAYLGFNESNDINIPYFFCNTESLMTDVLTNLVKTARCGIFVDEYNNIIIASKEYLSGINRDTDISLYGSLNDPYLPNIESLTIERKDMFNDGVVQFSPKFISKAPIIQNDSNNFGMQSKYGYNVTKLWELSNSTYGSSYSDPNNQSDMILASLILSTPLTKDIPTYDSTTDITSNNTINMGTSIWWIGRFAGYLYANGEIIKYDAVEYRIAGVGDVWISTLDEYQNYANNIYYNGWLDVTGRVRIWTEIENGTIKHHGRGYFGTPIAEHTATCDEFWLRQDNYVSIEMEYQALFTPCNVIGFTEWNISADPNTRWGGIGGSGVQAPSPTLQLSTVFNTSNKKNMVKTSALNWKGPSQSQDKNARTINYFRKPFDVGANYQRFGTRMRIIGEQVGADEENIQQPESQIKLYGNDSASGGLALYTDDQHQGYFLEAIAFRTNVDSTSIECPNGEDNAHTLVFYKVLSVRLENGSTVSMPFKLWGATIPVALDPGTFASEDVANSDTFNVIDLEIESYGNTFDFYFNGKKIGGVVDNLDASITYSYPYFDETTGADFNGDANRNVIRSIPPYNKNSKYWGVFIRGDSRVLFENVWAAEQQDASGQPNTDTPNVFGEVELQSNFGGLQIDDIFRKHSLSGFIQHGMLNNFVNNGQRYNITYEEFGTIFRECFVVDARYTEAFPALYARILPSYDLGNPFSISNEQLSPYGTEFIIFNVADKGIIVKDASAVIISGIVLNAETTMQISVDQYLQKKKGSNSIKVLSSKVDESRRKYGTKTFNQIETTIYMQTTAAAEQLLNWALDYLTTERIMCNANIFANPMLQLGDIVDLQKIEGKLIQDGTRMIVESIDYDYDSTGPTMSLGLREVL